MTFRQAFDHLQKIQSTKAPNTAAQCRAILKRLEWFNLRCPLLADFADQAEELWAEYVAENKGKHRMTHDRRYILMTLQRAYRKGWIPKLVTKADFPLKESHKPIGRALSDEEATRLVEASAKYPKVHLQILMGLTMGMRIREILHLRVDEVDLTNAEINLDPDRLKTRQPRHVPIPISDDVLPLLTEAIRMAPGPYIFPSSIGDPDSPRGHKVLPDKPMSDNRYHWDKVRKAAGVSCRFHDLRHSAVSAHLAAGMTISDAQKIFGAAANVIQRIYFHVHDDEMVAFRSRMRNKYKK